VSDIQFLKKPIAHTNYSGVLPQRHQDTKIIELFFIMAFLMCPTRINASNIEINEKTALINLNLSSLWDFVPWWLNGSKYFKKSKLSGLFLKRRQGEMCV
jgi:hypothetical protein